jgi:ATP-dependent Lon protease
LCEKNRKDIEEIKQTYLEGLTFHYVNTMKEVIELALTDEKVADAIDVK